MIRFFALCLAVVVAFVSSFVGVESASARIISRSVVRQPLFVRQVVAAPLVVGRSFIVAPQQLIVPQAVIQSQSFVVPHVQSFVAPVQVQSFSTGVGCGALLIR